MSVLVASLLVCSNLINFLLYEGIIAREKFNHGEFIAFSTGVRTIAPEENYSRLELGFRFELSLELELGGNFSRGELS